jgi:hypothetical protein
MKTICAIILAGSSLMFATDEPNDKTFGLENGRFWNTLKPDWKGVYVRGIYHGWKLRGNTEETMLGKVINAFVSSGNFDTNDLAAMVTSVYADAENLALPIGWVVLASLAVERGETDRTTVFLALRKQMTELLSGSARPNTAFDPLDTILASRGK